MAPAERHIPFIFWSMPACPRISDPKNNLKRQKNTTDDEILSLIECNNEEAKQDNSNNNPTMTSLLRCYDCFLVSTGMRSDEMLEGVVAIPLDMDEAMNVGYVVHRERKLSSRAQEYIAELNQLIMDCTDKNALVPSKEVARAVAGDTDGAADDTQDAPEDATSAEQHAVRRPRPSTPT